MDCELTEIRVHQSVITIQWADSWMWLFRSQDRPRLEVWSCKGGGLNLNGVFTYVTPGD